MNLQDPRKSCRFLYRISTTDEATSSVLPRYLRPGGPPGLIRWKIVAAWLKNEDLTQCKLNLRFGNGNSYL